MISFTILLNMFYMICNFKYFLNFNKKKGKMKEKKNVVVIFDRWFAPFECDDGVLGDFKVRTWFKH